MATKEEWHQQFVEKEGREPSYLDFEAAVGRGEIAPDVQKISKLWYVAEGFVAVHAAATLYLFMHVYFTYLNQEIAAIFGVFVLFGAWAVHYFYEQWLAGILLLVGNVLSISTLLIHWDTLGTISVSWLNLVAALGILVLIWFRKYPKAKKVEVSLQEKMND